MLLQNDIEEELWNTVQVHYNNGDYTGAVKHSLLFLTNLLRDKSDLSGDGTDLVNKAFSEKDPKIRINRLESTSDIDEQKGIANILRGAYQFIRNPRSHENFEDTENDCTAIIVFINYVAKRLRGSSGQFEVSKFVDQASDKRFVKSEDYCDELVAEIPERKFYETVAAVYSSRASIDIHNIQMLFASFFRRMKESQIDSFLKSVSLDLRETSNDNDIKYVVRIVPMEHWSKIDKIARLRTENRITESLSEGHFLATWCTHLFPLAHSQSKCNGVAQKGES